MNYTFVRLFRKFTRSLGIMVRKYNASTNNDARLLKQLQHHKIDYVIDIGANIGQYALDLIDQGYEGEILSFEPMQKEHAELFELSQKYGQWQVYDRCALGAESGEMTIHISKNSHSSSLLPMLDSHKAGEPESVYVAEEKVQIHTLDAVMEQLSIPTKRKVFIKLDVQGFEYEVLSGASKTLQRAQGVQVEVSLLPLFDGTKYLIDYYLDFFKELGFTLYGIHPVFTDNQTGRILQCDLTYFKE